MNKNTDTLFEELKKAKSVSEYLQDNESSMEGREIAEILSSILKEKDLVRKQVAKDGELCLQYTHQIFNGTKTAPSRDIMLCLCVGMGLNLEESQTLLKRCGYAMLYPKKQRDCVIIKGLDSGWSIYQINNELYELGEDTL
ncbi:MAG: hypothetical protein E7430_01790 [Ruminococcaceae bacterium]|nr:hypothetical protein [Oscillospiraceae bacterium]